MRDPNRIDPMLQAIAEAWKQCPDLRLGQLIVNAVNPGCPAPEVFYMEDDELVRRIEALIEMAKSHK